MIDLHQRRNRECRWAISCHTNNLDTCRTINGGQRQSNKLSKGINMVAKTQIHLLSTGGANNQLQVTVNISSRRRVPLKGTETP